MLDLKRMREDPALVLDAMRRRGDARAERLVSETLRADEARRGIIREVEALKAERNVASKAIAAAKRAGEDASARIADMRAVATRIKGLDADLASLEAEIRQKLLEIPNLPDPRVPPGAEGEAPTIAEWGTPRVDDIPPHWELGAGHGHTESDGARLPGGRTPALDLELGARITGTGFPVLVGGGARLSRALVQFMLDLHVREHGYLEILPPYLISRDSMTGVGLLPKFEEEAYRTEPDDFFLVPTAEVPLTNLHRGEILADADLPLAYVAHTPCFRREAGAAGRDTRGLLRVHQFDKVELVRLCRPEESEAEHERLTRHAERVLELLEVPYRRVLLPLGDLGFANAITYDLEIWAPGVQAWLEVSSCSSYTDYQARRTDIRYRPATGGRPVHPHTLNGSALALARLIVVLLETGYRRGEGIVLPEILHPYLGFERLDPCP